MESSSSDDDFVVLLLLKKRKRKEIFGLSILRYGEDGEFLLIKEQLDYHEQFKVLLQDISRSVWCFASEILEPHSKKKTINFCELSVQDIYSAWAARRSWVTWQSHSGFWRSLVRVALKCQNTSQNACCWLKHMIDHNMRLYLFFNVWNFGSSCAWTLNLVSTLNCLEQTI